MTLTYDTAVFYPIDDLVKEPPPRRAARLNQLARSLITADLGEGELRIYQAVGLAQVLEEYQLIWVVVEPPTLDQLRAEIRADLQGLQRSGWERAACLEWLQDHAEVTQVADIADHARAWQVANELRRVRAELPAAATSTEEPAEAAPADDFDHAVPPIQVSKEQAAIAKNRQRISTLVIDLAWTPAETVSRLQSYNPKARPTTPEAAIEAIPDDKVAEVVTALTAELEKLGGQVAVAAGKGAGR